MRTCFLLLVLLSACGRLWFDPNGGTGGDDTGDDGGPIDAPGDSPTTASGCVSPAVRCTFPGGLPCSCWGNPNATNAGMQEAGGNIKLTPNANSAGSQAACLQLAVPFDAVGTFAEVSQVVAGATGVTELRLNSGSDSYAIGIVGGKLTASGSGGIPVAMTAYLPAAMRWWRIRPAADRVLFETAADGKAWNLFTSVIGPIFSTVDVAVLAATTGPEATPGFAQFEGVNVCPP